MSLIDVYIFRHGETDWNKERRFQGHTDIPLNSSGEEQADLLRALVEQHQPEVILSSDLMRAKSTADIVNTNLNLPLHVTAKLRECHLGDVEGVLGDKIAELYGTETRDKWLSIHPKDNDFKFPNGETKTEHLERMTEYIESFVSQNSLYKKIAVSTHGGSLRRLVHHCLGAPTEPVVMGNCVLYKVTYNPAKSEWTFVGRVE
jgi:broad specificity phosphatase PhoE